MDFRRKRGYHIVFWKKETTPKTYKNVKAENHNPDEGERKTPEKQLSDLESISLQEKDFRLMIIMCCRALETDGRQRLIIYRKH